MILLISRSIFKNMGSILYIHHVSPFHFFSQSWRQDLTHFSKQQKKRPIVIYLTKEFSKLIVQELGTVAGIVSGSETYIHSFEQIARQTEIYKRKTQKGEGKEQFTKRIAAADAEKQEKERKEQNEKRDKNRKAIFPLVSFSYNAPSSFYAVYTYITSGGGRRLKR